MRRDVGGANAMPLTARRATTQVIVMAPFLTDSDWTTLQAAVQSGAEQLTLTCCGGGAYLRTSPRGLRHFAHLPNATVCATAKRETIEHLRAKAEIAWACQAHGYAVTLEYPYGDWRADVYAEKDGDRRAFEVQWSAQTLAETERRHVRYQRDGVRDCWFFRTLPPDYQPKGTLPAFALSVDANERTGIQLSRQLGADLRTTEIYALGTFVGDLLTNRVRWCDHAHAHTMPDCEIVVFYTHCYRCKKAVYVYSVGNPLSACGLEIRLSADQRFKLSLDAAVRAAVHDFLATPAGQRLSISVDGRHFQCGHCGADQKDARIIELSERVRQGLGDVVARTRQPITFTRPPTVALPHWCYPRENDFCCNPYNS